MDRVQATGTSMNTHVAPWKRRKILRYLKHQQEEWQALNGPVTVRKATTAELGRLPTDDTSPASAP
jgi:hypothetical protein